MVGTVWAMRKKTYLAVGGLDTSLKAWGGENIDLPLKVGTLKMIKNISSHIY